MDGDPPRVDPGNAEQLRIWDTDEGVFWAENADRFDQTTSWGAALLAAARISKTDRVLDVGCGNGETSCDAARLTPAGSVLGLDLSRPMLERARGRAGRAGLVNLRFVAGDAQIYPFEPASFDVVVSRMAMMFVADLPAASGNLARALRPGGRLAVMAWQSPAANIWVQVLVGAVQPGLPSGPAPLPGAPGPFAMADPERVIGLLVGAGFSDVAAEPVTGQITFGHAVDEAIEFVTGFGAPKFALDRADSTGRSLILANLRQGLSDHVTDAGISLACAAWIYTGVR